MLTNSLLSYLNESHVIIAAIEPDQEDSYENKETCCPQFSEFLVLLPIIIKVDIILEAQEQAEIYVVQPLMLRPCDE
jgi:hypothetical protein